MKLLLLIALGCLSALAAAQDYSLQTIDRAGNFPIRRLQPLSPLLNRSVVLVTSGRRGEAFELSMGEIETGRFSFQTVRAAVCTVKEAGEVSQLESALLKGTKRADTAPASWYGLLFLADRYFWDELGPEEGLKLTRDALLKRSKEYLALAPDSIWLTVALCSTNSSPYPIDKAIQAGREYLRRREAPPEFAAVLAGAMNFHNNMILLNNPNSSARSLQFGLAVIELLDATIKSHPDAHMALYQRCAAHAIQGQKAKALQDAKAFLKTGKGLPYQKANINRFIANPNYNAAFRYAPGTRGRRDLGLDGSI